MGTKTGLVKKIGLTLLFPPKAFLLLFPLALGAMLYGMLSLGESHPATIAAYGVAFYSLILWCARTPELFRFIKTFKEENRYTRAWFGNHRLRMNVTLTGSVLWNGAYGALQLGLGIYHRSVWFFSLAAYYACLAVMRFFLVRHTLRHEPGKERRQELRYYGACGWIFLPLNLALSGMMLYMIRENRVTHHHEITTIAMAAYTFLTLTMAIVNLFRYRRYDSPVISASRAVSLAATCVSLLSLENTMIFTFGNGSMTAHTRQLFLALSGGAVSLVVITMAIYMILNAKRQKKKIKPTL